MKKTKLMYVYIAFVLAYIAISSSSCKKKQSCQECTIITKLVDGGGESQSQYTNCDAPDATGAETVVIKDNRIIARSTYICGAFKYQ